MRRAFALLVLLAVAARAGAVPLDPAAPGRFAVGVATVEAVDVVRERFLTTELWYPASTAGRDAPPLERRSPLVVVSHGFCGSRLNHEYLTTHLASHGFLVAAPDLSGYTAAACAAGPIDTPVDALPQDLSFVGRALHDRTGRLGAWARRVRGVATGIAGHSLGGWAAVQAARIDPLFTTVVGLAPAVQAADADPLAHLTPRRVWMAMGATGDTLVSFTGWTERFFATLPAPAFLVRVAGGSHGGFGDADSRLSANELAVQQAAVTRNATALFLRYVARKPKLARRLKPYDDGTVALTVRLR